MQWPASISRAVSQTRCNPWPKLARFRAAAQRLVRSAWAQHRICLLADAFLRNGSLSGDKDIGSCVEPHLSRRIRVVHAPSMAACAVAQQEIFNDKLAVATRERSPTGTAGYVVEGGLWSSFDFDDLIQCLAVRAREGNKRRGPAASHLRPQSPILNCDTTPISSFSFVIAGRQTSRVWHNSLSKSSSSYSSEASLIKAPWFKPGAFFLTIAGALFRGLESRLMLG
jgi:hypothetical protein